MENISALEKAEERIGQEIRSQHAWAYRTGEWATIKGVDSATYNRLVWLLEWPDGKTDEWVVDDEMAEYEFRAAKPEILPLLSRGDHARPEEGEACIMEMVAYVSQPHNWTDMPACTARVISRTAQIVNDWLPEEKRRALWSEFPRLFDTSILDNNSRFQRRYAEMVMETYKEHAFLTYATLTWVLSLDVVLEDKDYPKAELYAGGLESEILLGLSDHGMYEEMVKFLRDLLDIADEIMGRTSYRQIDLEPLAEMFGQYSD